ncbi:MAG TPA: acyl-CoA reductase [Bacteroidales bacterium]|nr:acyl-CoA reductase [Bacteroidales bacterium]HOH22738.1 acyl-CoA reductase [Bacteroidales bacterium]HPZ03076.1 acyl-CoA reductase [Bacteroidales bacterium]HQB74698.1 acyl-CoA reductase [Bacteroidales bacterium]
MNLKKRLQLFETLRDEIREFLVSYPNVDENNLFYFRLSNAIKQQSIENKWFIPIFILRSLEAIVEMLDHSGMDQLLSAYPDLNNEYSGKDEKVLVISAGNIPLAAFHDFFSVLVSGNRYVGKLSSEDHLLLPVLASRIIELDPYFKDRITFVESINGYKTGDGKLALNKVIATGSNNSARYFNYYFGAYPLLLRKNRNSVAIIDGEESLDDLLALSKDVFTYFGLGCRSVSKIYIPVGYPISCLIEGLLPGIDPISDHHSYLNNLEYQKTVYLMNRSPFYDAGPFILVENSSFSSPISVLHFEFYEDVDQLLTHLFDNKDQIQAVSTNNVSMRERINGFQSRWAVPFGKTQVPDILSYPDGVDIIQFCNL